MYNYVPYLQMYEYVGKNMKVPSGASHFCANKATRYNNIENNIFLQLNPNRKCRKWKKSDIF